MDLKKLLVRTLSGAVFVAVLITSIIVSEWTFLALMLVLSSLGIKEFHHITHAHHRIEVQRGTAITANCFLQLGAFAYAFAFDIFKWLELPQPRHVALFFVPYILVIIITFVAELFSHCEHPMHNLAYFVLGQVFVSLPFASLYGILSWGDTWQPHLLLSIFLIIWVNDTFAYLVGSAFGKHHLLKHVSPHKSWEGFVGGAVFAIGAGLLLGYFKFAPEEGLNPMTLWQWAAFAVVTVVFGTLGDLLESLLKRAVGKKDAGNIIPGHGGILDRFDSTLLAGPAIYLYLLFVLS